MSESYDAIVIGTGQAGPPLAGRLTAAGMRVAIIERKLFGGTCVNTGCIPTKTMVASAYATHVARRASEYGVNVTGPVTADMKRIKARKDEISGKSKTGVEAHLREMKNCTVYQGHARFESSREVRVDGRLLTGEKIFMDVGGRAMIPAIPGLDKIRYLTNSSMLELDSLPRHLVILGGSYIGLEFGQMFRRFGSEVTIVEQGPRLIPREDEDVSAEIRQILQGEGIEIRAGTKCTRVSGDGDNISVELDTAGQMQTLHGSHLLLAIGRRPNTEDLGLDKAGVATDAKGYVVVDDQLRTNVPGIWALGDCNGKGAFTHTSYNDFEIVAANLLDVHPPGSPARRVSDRIPTYALFIDPPLGRAGLTDAEVRNTGKKALVGKRLMSKVGRAIEKGETQGFMKIVVDAETRRILGAALLGTGCDEVIHSILDVMYAKSPYDTILRAMHIHPTVSELVPTMLGELQPLT